MKRIVSKILVIFFSVSFVAATIFFDQASRSDASREDTFNFEVFEQQDDDTITKDQKEAAIESGSDGRVSLSVGENAMFRFSPESSAKLKIIPPEVGIFPSVAATLTEGRLWVDARASALPVSVTVDDVEISGVEGVFDVQVGEGRVIVSALTQHVFVTFSGRRLVVPEASVMTISLAKIQATKDTVSELHLSKLLKEFPFAPLTERDEWMTVNTRDDGLFFEEFRKDFSEQVRTQGGQAQAAAGTIGTFMGIVQSLDTALTFDARKRDEKNIEHAASAIDAAFFSTLLGDAASMKRHLAEFGRIAASISDEARTTSLWKNTMSARFNQVVFAPPYAPYFDTKQALRSVLFSDTLPRLEVGFRDVLSIAGKGPDAETREKTAVALRAFASLVNREQQRLQNPDASEDLFFLSIRLNDFIKRHPEFLREEWLKISELLESAHLRLVQGRDESDDQRQYFLGEKIALIRSIEALLKSQKVSFQDARKSMLLLGNAVEALKPTFSDTAIVAFFDAELAQLRPLLAFLRSPEAVYVRGSYEESMKDFENRQGEIREVQELLASANGGTEISPARREELASQIARDFAALNVSNVELVFPESADDTKVTVESAEISETAFSAAYDTERKLFTNIVIAGESVSQGVRLENFQRFFFLKIGRLAAENGETIASLTEEPSGHSVVERVTVTKLIDELKKLNVTVEDKYFGLENFNDGVIHVRLALMGEGADAKVFSFDVSHKSSVISNLKVQTVLGEIPVNDSFGLRELPVKVTQIYQRAVFEKQKEEELKKFLEEEEAVTEEE